MPGYKKAKADIQSIVSALTLYKLDNFQYPSTEAGIRALVEKPPSGEAPNWKSGGYIRKLPMDSWNNEYGYDSNGLSIEVYSLGGDGKPGGEGEAADIFWSKL